MSIRAKLLSSFLFLTLLIVIQFVTSQFFAVKENELIREIVIEHEISAQLSGLSSAAQKIRRFEKEYFIYVQDSIKREKYFKEFGEAKDEINGYISRLKQIFSKSRKASQISVLSVWEIATKIYTDGFENLNQRVKDGEITEVLQANTAIQEPKNKFRVVLSGTAESIENQYQLAETKAERITQYKSTSSMISIVVSGISVIVALLVSFQVPASIVKPLKQLTDIANSISKGQVNQSIEISGSREIVNLARSIERLQVATLGLLKRVQSAKRAPQNGGSS